MDGPESDRARRIAGGRVGLVVDQHAVCVLDNDGRVLERFDLDHDAAGLRQAVGRLGRRRVRGVGIERGTGRWSMASSRQGWRCS